MWQGLQSVGVGVEPGKVQGKKNSDESITRNNSRLTSPCLSAWLSRSVVSLTATPWIVPASSSSDLPNLGIQPVSGTSPCVFLHLTVEMAGSVPLVPPGKPLLGSIMLT